MTPVDFPEANTPFCAPADLVESQCQTIRVYRGEVEGGSVDGLPLVVTAWKPTVAELQRLHAGGVVYVSFIGGLPPHFVTMDFHSATHPA